MPLVDWFSSECFGFERSMYRPTDKSLLWNVILLKLTDIHECELVITERNCAYSRTINLHIHYAYSHVVQ